jgi:hypothetical protein
MARKRQREIALAAVAIVLIAVAALRIRTAISPSDRAAQVAAATQNKQHQSNQKAHVTQLDLQALEAERPEPVDGTRNPFRFQPKPAPPPPISNGPSVPPPVPVGGPLESSEPPSPPRIPLKFITLMESEKTGRVAVLTDGRGVYHGKEGSIIEGRYRILKIGVESVDLAYLDGRGRQTIRLTGQ